VKDKTPPEHYTTSEWTQEEWRRHWNISVGAAYACEKCGNMIMITKGGVGTLEPYCCDELMKPVKGESL
jgi:hypothetical protein